MSAGVVFTVACVGGGMCVIFLMVYFSHVHIYGMGVGVSAGLLFIFIQMVLGDVQ